MLLQSQCRFFFAYSQIQITCIITPWVFADRTSDTLFQQSHYHSSDNYYSSQGTTRNWFPSGTISATNIKSFHTSVTWKETISPVVHRDVATQLLPPPLHPSWITNKESDFSKLLQGEYKPKGSVKYAPVLFSVIRKGPFHAQKSNNKYETVGMNSYTGMHARRGPFLNIHKIIQTNNWLSSKTAIQLLVPSSFYSHSTLSAMCSICLTKTPLNFNNRISKGK